MWDLFAAIWAVVDDGSKTAISETFLFRNGLSGQEEVAQGFFVLCFGLADTYDRFFGYDEQVNWGLWIDVTETQAKIILIKDVCGYFPIGNFFKEGGHVRRG